MADRSMSMGFPRQAEVCDSKWLLEELSLKQLLTVSDYPPSRINNQLSHIMLAHKVPEKNSQIWRRFDIQEGMNSHTAELCDGQDSEHLQGLSEPEGEKGSDSCGEASPDCHCSEGRSPDGR